MPRAKTIKNHALLSYLNLESALAQLKLVDEGITREALLEHCIAVKLKAYLRLEDDGLEGFLEDLSRDPPPVHGVGIQEILNPGALHLLYKVPAVHLNLKGRVLLEPEEGARDLNCAEWKALVPSDRAMLLFDREQIDQLSEVIANLGDDISFLAALKTCGALLNLLKKETKKSQEKIIADILKLHPNLHSLGDRNLQKIFTSSLKSLKP